MTTALPLTTDRLLDAAEAIVQRLGFAGLSFRDLAACVGIRSASVHYHYPTKADLGRALTRRYTDRLAARLDTLEASHPPAQALAEYVDVFRTVFLLDGRMCLCGMLAAEAEAIPAQMQEELRRFVSVNLSWTGRMLERIDTGTQPPTDARVLFASLEGALLLARATGDASVFDAIEQRLPGRTA